MIIELSTDGSCYPNPGPGGWAAIFRTPGHAKAIFGYAPYTTNIQMEMTAVIEALEYLKKGSEINLYTDSEFTLKGATVWLNRWKQNGFMTAAYNNQPPKPVANQALWVRLDEAMKRHKINWTWVRGHAYHPDNLLCDKIALEARNSQLRGERILEEPVVEPDTPGQRAISFEDE